MNIFFEIPKEYNEVIDEIQNECGEKIYSKEKLSGDQIIAILAIATPIVWDLVFKYVIDKKVEIKVELEEGVAISISERSPERALEKAKKIKKEWEKQQIIIER